MMAAPPGAAMSKLGRAAIAYAERFGWAVFPLAPRSKLPAIEKRFGGRGCLDATTDIRQIEAWWDINPNRNIGIATGTLSGIFVLDVDPGHGGEETLAALVQRHGALPETVISRTGGGGQHLLFKHVAGIRNSAGRLGPGLDVRGVGGYIVAPPSISRARPGGTRAPRPHPWGRPYAWDVDHDPDERPVADAPAWLIEQLREKPNNGIAELPETWRRLAAEGVCEGARNDAIARLSGHLLRRDVDPLVVLDLLRCWNATRCQPPLDDAELVRTVKSIARREMQRRSEVTSGR
jgi:hypothetical protein